MRERFALALLSVLFVEIVGIFSLAVFVGLGTLHYAAEVYEFGLPSLSGQFVAMVYVVVKYLFSRSLRQSLDNMMSGNK
jgi:hypothetical protein